MRPSTTIHSAIAVIILSMGMTACFPMPFRPPKSYVVDSYETLKIDRVLVIPPTGGPPEEADSLTTAMMETLAIKDAFDVSVYSVGEDAELDHAVMLAHRYSWGIPTDVIRQIGAKYPEYDAVLSITEVTGYPGLSYRTKLAYPWLWYYHDGSRELSREKSSRGTEFLTSFNPISQAYLHLRLFDSLSGTQLWKVRIDHSERGNVGKILRRLPEDIDVEEFQKRIPRNLD